MFLFAFGKKFASGKDPTLAKAREAAHGQTKVFESSSHISAPGKRVNQVNKGTNPTLISLSRIIPITQSSFGPFLLASMFLHLFSHPRLTPSCFPPLYSRPVPREGQWPLYTSRGQQYYVWGTNESWPQIGRGPRTTDCAFWNELMPILRQNQGELFLCVYVYVCVKENIHSNMHSLLPSLEPCTLPLVIWSPISSRVSSSPTLLCLPTGGGLCDSKIMKPLNNAAPSLARLSSAHLLSALLLLTPLSLF